MFASKTPRDLFNPGPETGDYWWDQRYAAAMHHAESQFSQHNEPNPILVEFREVVANLGTPPEGIPGEVQWWLYCLESPESLDVGYDWTPEQIEHARRVLTRLARLAEGVEA